MVKLYSLPGVVEEVESSFKGQERAEELVLFEGEEEGAQEIPRMN